MIISAAVALSLLMSTQGQIPEKYKQQYQDAQKYEKDPKKATAMEERYFPGGKKPKTCSDECDMMEKVMDDSCDRKANKKPGMAKSCKAKMEDLVKTCRGSCAEKGKIDEDYMKKHMPKPKAPPGRSGPRPAAYGGDDN